MMLRTHMMFAILGILIFFQYVNNQIVFGLMVLIATVVPDLDSNFSSYGRHLIFRPLQYFVTHRGVIHSFTSAVFLSAIIAIWLPAASFGFFVGYSIHLIVDSFTRDGIVPFWPLRWKSSGPLVSGGKIEETMFLGLIFINAFLFVVVVLLS
jgi:membrane-bound metal-dependent hydrolase YbcI (DUF457 family)